MTDLLDLQAALAKATDALDGVLDTEVVGESVYVSVGYLAAVVITPALSSGVLSYELVATEWDRSGGVHAEMWLAEVRLEYVRPVVDTFLRILREQEL